MRPSWIEIDLDAIEANVRSLRAAVAPAALCAVVKADGYGHGDVPVAEAARAGGADWLAVALVEEGVRLREAGVRGPILLLSEPADGDAASIVRWDLHPTVYTPEFADAISAAVGSKGPFPIHLKLNTGMHRVGVDAVNAFALARKVAADPRLALEGLWTPVGRPCRCCGFATRWQRRASSRCWCTPRTPQRASCSANHDSTWSAPASGSTD